MTKSPVKIVALLVVLTTCPIGCRRQDPPPAIGERPLTISYCCDEWMMSPFWGMPIMHAVFLPLTVAGPDGEPVPRLALDWQHSTDFSEWTIRIRDDLLWHDGVPVTAADVVFTLELLSHPEANQYNPDNYAVELIDDYSYSIRYLEPGPGNPYDWYTVYYPEHLLADLDPAQLSTWKFWTEPIGNGPFRYARHVPGMLMELAANSDFALDRPRISHLAIKFNQGAPTLPELLGGEVDLAPYISRLDALQLSGYERLEVYRIPSTHRAKAIDWNQRREPFGDPQIRRALTLAIDRREILRAFDLPAETPLSDVVFTPRQLARGELPPLLEADPQEAQRLLAEAGWRDSDHDGILDRHGKPFRFTALVSTGGEGPDLAVLVQAQLRRIGVAMEIDTLDGAAAFRRKQAADFDVSFADHMLTSLSEGKAMASVLGSDSLLGYDRPEVAALLATMEQTLDPKEVDRLCREMWPYLQEDLPITFLHPTVTWTVARRNVRGIDSWIPDPTMILDRLWIEETPATPLTCSRSRYVIGSATQGVLSPCKRRLTTQ